MRIGINGFGRMGRLALRAGWDLPELEFVHVNDPAADDATLALLTEFDSVQGRWDRSCDGGDEALVIDGRRLARTRATDPAEIDWTEHGVDLVLECSGRFRTLATAGRHLERGARRVVVSAPVKDGAPDVVLGVNDGDIDLRAHPILTAASCTTNCLAPVVKVLHDAIGIERGVATTIHAPTNTQVVVDGPHKDPRRARASQLSLIPTSSNSAYAVTRILPELAGRLTSMAVRVPVLNASLTDLVCQVSRETTAEEVNEAFCAAAEGPMRGILGYETRPLVSADYAGDPRSSIVDAGSTLVTDGSLVKVLAWYDNEWGYANRLAELAARVARAVDGAHA